MKTLPLTAFLLRVHNAQCFSRLIKIFLFVKILAISVRVWQKDKNLSRLFGKAMR